MPRPPSGKRAPPEIRHLPPPVAVNQTVVRAYLQRYTRTQIETALDSALADHASGVAVTNVTFEGGGASGQRISGDPGYLVEHLQAALDQLDDPESANRPMSTSFDLSKRTWGT